MSEVTNPTPKKNLIKRIFIWLLSILAAACLVAGITVPVLVLIKNKDRIPGTDVSNSATSDISNNNYDYLNKNSVSLLFSATPNSDFVTKVAQAVTQHFSATYSVLPKGSIANIDCGTSWIVDYSTNPNANLVTYYLATNIHVVNLSYSLTFKLLPKATSNLFENVQPSNLTLSFPINPQTTSQFSAYICQPLGKKTPDYPNGLPIVSNNPQVWNQQWFQIPNINLNTLNEDIIPLGAINPSNNEITASTGYLGSYSIVGGINGSGYLTQNGYVPESNADVNTTTNGHGQDFALVKMILKTNQVIGPNSALRFVWPYGWVSTVDDKNNPLSIMFKQMNQMFSIKPTNQISIQSSYLQKLNYLIQQLENKTLTKQEFNQYFMFGNVKQLTNTKNLYVAGYPGNDVNANGMSIVYFNAGQTVANTISQVNNNLSRKNLEYYYQGKIYLEQYWKNNNYLLPGVNLFPGSSGSMVVNDNNQIIGIYWGAIKNGGSVGLFTPFYVSGNKNNLLYILLQYQSRNDPNSQLVHLFKLLANWNN